MLLLERPFRFCLFFSPRYGATIMQHTNTPEWAKSELTNDQVLGWSTSWGIPSGTILNVNQVRQAAVDAGFSPDLVHDLSNLVAFNRGCEDLREARVIDRLKRDPNSNVVKFQFTRKHLEQGLYEHDHECVLYLNIETGSITCPDKPELVKIASDKMSEALQARGKKDITNLIKKMFRKVLREETGHEGELFDQTFGEGRVYLVHSRYGDFLNRVEKFVIGIGGKFSRMSIAKGDKKTTEDFADHAERGFHKLIDEVKDVVNKWDDKTRASTMSKYAERYRELKHKMDSYKHVLGERLQYLNRFAEAAEQQMTKRVHDIANGLHAAEAPLPADSQPNADNDPQVQRIDSAISKCTDESVRQALQKMRNDRIAELVA